MIDKAKILELAKKRASAEIRLQVSRMANVPSSYEERLKSDAASILIESAANEACRAYNDAIQGLTSDQLLDIMQSEG